MEQHPIDLFIRFFVRPLSWETSNKNIGKFNLAYLILPFFSFFILFSNSLLNISVKIFSLSNWFSLLFMIWMVFVCI